uniref:Uncharacterized protein n=1 Tax=Rhizophora mucronata TaxID=61149 RepID=A0A2P2IJE2_RHIMU
MSLIEWYPQSHGGKTTEQASAFCSTYYGLVNFRECYVVHDA